MQDYLNRGWTIVTLKEHLEEVSELRDKLDAMKDKLEAANDRRYMEVNIEREKALKIKEEADKAALGLAREIQSYKDEKANELREQINRERGHYVSRGDLDSAMRELKAIIDPLVGTRREGQNITVAGLLGAVTIAVAISAVVVNYLHWSPAASPAANIIPGPTGTQTIPIAPHQ